VLTSSRLLLELVLPALAACLDARCTDPALADPALADPLMSGEALRRLCLRMRAHDPLPGIAAAGHPLAAGLASDLHFALPLLAPQNCPPIPAAWAHAPSSRPPRPLQSATDPVDELHARLAALMADPDPADPSNPPSPLPLALRQRALTQLLRRVAGDGSSAADTESLTFSDLLHRFGVNLRHLGRLRTTLRSAGLRALALLEMAARTLKHLLNCALRSAGGVRADRATIRAPPSGRRLRVPACWSCRRRRGRRAPSPASAPWSAST
jgi:hypothetical protein